MRTLNLLLLSLIFTNLLSQEFIEKEIETQVDEVTVFLNGAQIVRKASVDLAKGNTILKFVNLSPFIDAKSIQVKAEGELTILSVNHQQNYLDKMEKSNELTDLENQLEALESKIDLENTYLSIIKEELSFLQENRNIGGRNEEVNITNLQLASEFYGNKLTDLKLKEIEKNKILKDLNKKKNDLQNQIKTMTSKKEYPAGEILVKAETDRISKYSLELTYLVENAGWFPSYDIRAKTINEPVQLVYKANVKQDTKVDWSNVKLTFSSADPNVSGVAPELKTYFLNYYTLPPVYKMTTNSVRGKIFESNGEPLPGASVIVEGTTIGTVSDLEGNYSITIPDNSSLLTYSFIGFDSKTLPVTNSVMNVSLEEREINLEEVVVVGFGSSKPTSDMLIGRAPGLDIDKPIRVRGTDSSTIPTVQFENQTTFDFQIAMPYSIKSDNKNYTVDMESYNLPADYQYYCVPKIDKNAFLIANIADWEKFNLMEGEANVFFEGTYIGKTLIDVRFASDTLEISLGRDKMVAVNREKIKEFTNKQFVGSKKEEFRAWTTTVKNNKNQKINMIILDQIPVSTLSEIEVKTQDISGGILDKEKGEIKWEIDLDPNEKKEIELKYSVKYPKNRNLVVE